MAITAEQIMLSPEADIHVDHNLVEAEARFRKYGRQRLLVLDADEVVGTLHRDDLPEDRSAWKRLSVQEVMDGTSLATCGPDEDVAGIRELLRVHPFVLVIDRERGILGIIERDEAPDETVPDFHYDADRPGNPTGGRSPARIEGKLAVYAERPRVRRLREPR